MIFKLSKNKMVIKMSSENYLKFLTLRCKNYKNFYISKYKMTLKKKDCEWDVKVVGVWCGPRYVVEI